ncbi:MAG: very short patch repair endonuclease [Chloroflexota bacterium]|nr:very short patch repair endonuclease [Chloroflexota bacterium]MDE2941080.1 very short patch repair endonuclease [Chloroflexota bacterium]MDE3267394.1 very short patch repair endonuclease [Chloroflexota bacterium]
MPDLLTKDERSALMSRVRNRGTSAESYVRRAVWNSGFRYRLNVRRLPGAPDLVLRRYKTAVLVQGCFWHGHSCRKGQTRPASNREFWNQKLDGNVQRDALNQCRLHELGWSVFVIWECLLDEGTNVLLEFLRHQRDAVGKSNYS